MDFDILPNDVRVLAGSNNPLWQFGRHCLASRRYSYLKRRLKDWQPTLASLTVWAPFGFNPQRRRARDLNDGTIEIFLALACLRSRNKDSRLETFVHLANAVARYQGLSRSSARCPRPPVAQGGGLFLLECLAHLEKAWHEKVAPETFDTVRAALFRAGESMSECDSLLGLSQHKIALPGLFANRRGEVRQLTLEWFNDGSRRRPTFFFDPSALGLTVFEADFVRSHKAAWRYALASGAADQLPKNKAPLFPPGSRICWGLTLTTGNRTLETKIEGESLGASFAAGLVGLATKRRFDKIAVTAKLLPKGRLGGLRDYDALGLKLAVAKNKDLVGVIVAPENFNKPKDVEGAIAVYRAATVNEALDHLVGLAEKFERFLERLNRRFTRDYWNYRPGRPTVADELYIPRTVTRIIGDDKDSLASQTSAARTWSENDLPQFPQFILTGAPGSGKTRFLFSQYRKAVVAALDQLRSGEVAVAQLRLPIYTSMSALLTDELKNGLSQGTLGSSQRPARRGAVRVASGAPTTEECLDAIQSRLIEIAVEAAIDVGETEPEVLNLIATKVRSGRIVLLLDSFTYSDTFACVRAALDLYLSPGMSPDANLVLAVQRVNAFDPSVVSTFGRNLPLFDLVLLADSEIKEYITKFFSRDRNRRDAVLRHVASLRNDEDLFRTPLFLKMYCDLIKRSRTGDLPVHGHSRASMYRLFLDDFPDDLHHVEGDDASDLRELALRLGERPQQINLLVELAWELSRRSQNEEPQIYSTDDLIDGLAGCTESLRVLGWTVEEACKYLTMVEPVLIPVPSGLADRYCFVHRTFHDYLAATAIVRRSGGDRIEFDDALFFDPAWNESFALVGGILAEEKDEEGRLPYLLVRLLKTNATDLLHRPLLIAAQVIVEARQRWPGAQADVARLLVQLAVNDYAATGIESIVPALKRLGSVVQDALEEASRSLSENYSATEKLERLRKRIAPGDAVTVLSETDIELGPQSLMHVWRKIIHIANTDVGSPTLEQENIQLHGFVKRLIRDRPTTPTLAGSVEFSPTAAADFFDWLIENPEPFLKRYVDPTERKQTAILATVVRVLQWIGELSPVSIPNVLRALLTAAKSGDVVVQRKAVRAIGMVGRGDPECIDALLALLTTAGSGLANLAIESLGKVAIGDKRSAESLISMLNIPALALPAAIALVRLEVRDLRVQDTLIAKLGVANEDYRLAAADALGSFTIPLKNPISPELAVVPEHVRIAHVTIQQQFAQLVAGLSP
jgi:hypothetical protein